MYDDYEDEFGEYPPRRPRRPHRRFSLHWKLVVVAVLVLGALGLRFSVRGPQRPVLEPERKQIVKVVNWQEVDVRIRAAVEDAHAESRRYAEQEVGLWTKELRGRVESDFLPWYFNYWNQQALALKAIGYHLADTVAVEALAGEQPSANDQLSALIEEAFAARVLRPQSAQLTVETIARESVEIYLLELGEQLAGLQAEFSVPAQEWNRHLRGLSGIALAIEGNRAVPVVTKAAVAGSGVAAAKLVRVVVAHARALVLRMTGRELVEGGARLGARYAARGLGWWITAGVMAWDLADHHRTVQQNLPVLRRSLNGYLDELEQRTLHDPESGLFQLLDGVQREVLRELKPVEK